MYGRIVDETFDWNFAEGLHTSFSS